MLTNYTEYEFQRDSSGKTISLTAKVGIYRGAIPTREQYFRTTPDQDTDFTKFEVSDFSSSTPIEVIKVPYNIPSNLQTTSTPVDRSGETPERNGEFEINLLKIKMILDEEGDIIEANSTLSEKYATEVVTL